MSDPFEISKASMPGAGRRGVKRGLKMADQMAQQARRDMVMNAATGKTKVRRVSRAAQSVAGKA